MLQKRAIFINTASQVVVRFVTLAFTLISIKLLANYLGPAGVGNYNTITTYINFFIIIADLGLFAVAVREISKKPETEKKILSNVFVIRLISALIACFVAVILVNLTEYSSDIKLGVFIAIGFLLFNLLGSIYDIALQYRLKMQYSALAEFLSKLVTIVALYIIIKEHGNFLWVVSTIALSGFLIFIFKWLFSVRFITFWPSYDKKLSAWIFAAAWPLGIVYIINNLYFKLDTMLLFVMKGSVVVGLYTTAYKVLDVTVFIGSYFASALKPTISRNIESNKEAVGSIIEKSIIVMLAIAMPLAVICVTFSKEIILFISNAEFLEGSKALVLLSFTLPLIYLDSLLGEVLVAGDQRKLLIKIAVFVLAFNFIANLLIIPKYSFMGAATTTLASEFLLLIVNLYYTKKTVPYKLRLGLIGKIFIISIITLIAGILLRSTNIYFLILIPIVVIIYALLAYLFNIVNYKTFLAMMKTNA